MGDSRIINFKKRSMRAHLALRMTLTLNFEKIVKDFAHQKAKKEV
jgi:hypothetical protein